ncbi:hypothetical protein PAXRUDRAFT_289071 [Paxillus rubicundulus Ve08.2h10]|uniref:Uncharacterized protein n=1 Tax=Paxillus rubicundulus Ve08.2h10 TaxID=930991 RepID=A0A0D0E5L6_9AGAM|nr:hypothetical protein PAXRUDRAFT_289071 [Paxillus rubicundulus Ve08.2h10]
MDHRLGMEAHPGKHPNSEMLQDMIGTTEKAKPGDKSHLTTHPPLLKQTRRKHPQIVIINCSTRDLASEPSRRLKEDAAAVRKGPRLIKKNGSVL